jgi:iron(III) transport system ATP-binding protein
MHLLEVNGVSKKENETFVVKTVSFKQNAFQKIAITGATGSGKTSILKMIAGLLHVDEGSVLFEEKKVLGPEEKLIPGHPHIGYLSQHFELRHHYKVSEVLEMANLLSQEEANKIYAICKIDHLLNRWTHELSGGERQRIALARVLVTSPKLLLLDEPYSNLDTFHKTLLKEVLHQLGNELKLTFILIAHDPQDVLSWADEIIVLQNGRIVQQASPQKIYYHPVSEYVASLFGKYNSITRGMEALFPELKNKHFVRPEAFKINNDSIGLKAVVVRCIFSGIYYETEVTIDNETFLIYTHQFFPVNSNVLVSLRHEVYAV